MSADTLPADRSREDLAELIAHLAQIERWIAPIAREDRSCPGDADDDLSRARMALLAYARDVDLLSETARRLTAERDAAVGALERYAMHDDECRKAPVAYRGVVYGERLPPHPCTCGLDTARTAAAPARTTQETL